MLVKTYSATIVGVDALRVDVETDNARERQSRFALVGLPDAAVRESWYRVDTACSACGFATVLGRLVVNLSPADIKKEGTTYDLPIALSYLATNEVIPADPLMRFLIAGELSLDGSIRPIKGALPFAILARQQGFEGIILPQENAREAAIVNRLKVYGARHLREVTDFFNGKETLKPTVVDTRAEFERALENYPFDFSEVRGQDSAVRALEVAAAGGHNVLMVGSPGSGKSMMAKRIPGILPPLTLSESLETTKVYSVAGALPQGASLLKARPFRSPHHSVSMPALVGGGTNPKPGEISLAHNGVLFLDEVAEFRREVLELLRQPMEDREIVIARAKAALRYPSSFMLVAAMNPCPCGFFNDPTHRCTCPPGAAAKYMRRISGPLMDRIDIQIETRPVPFDKLSAPAGNPIYTTAAIRERVVRARQIQTERFAHHPHIHSNAQMTPNMVKEFVPLERAAALRLQATMQKRGLSARAYDRILKVSRTIADLDNSPVITDRHIGEAVLYRALDRSGWGEAPLSSYGK